MESPMSIAPSQPVHLPSISRETVRAFVSAECGEFRRVAATGGNVHQYQLDRQDQVTAFAATLSPDDAATFWTLYSEELEADTAAVLDNVAAINAQTSEALMRNAVQAGQVGTWVALVMFFVGVIIMITFLKR